MKKLAVSKFDNDKYNSEETGSNIIGINLPDDMTKKYVNSLKIQEILKPDTFEKLKTKFQKDDIIKSSNYKVDEQHFRSVFEPSNIDKFNMQLSKDIERDKVNLIKYLHSKKEVSHKLIEKLNTFDDSKLTKINRICKIYFHYENYERIAKEKIKDKMKENDQSKKLLVKEVVSDIGKDLRRFDNILNQYPKKDEFLIKKAYREKHSQFEGKYWAKNKSNYMNPQHKGGLIMNDTYQLSGGKNG
eukprot:CAMPEP_0170523452 /NCGR_PEP_ID=MMETSP0209-20121228/8866_1 /TAXON_ID=665100 ORGANISM="Litonotus pictus, Strain P1" /NCGR_SAMPLE_ID=MMETSP0209 /ASSEMBLY_ACC=CAM_ASM_000301 /LENGTH=243 /DNA_ID=CAMNT_0010811533 /DNA_START=342 /DNA_END=1069 /DNA_ORIENTATION=-